MSGHYIAYKFIEGTVYHFDDAMVNSTPMLSEYETNLIFYHRADIPPYAWDIDFGFITQRSPDLYGQKTYSLRGSLPISIDLNKATVDNQPVLPEAIPITMMTEATPLPKDSQEVHANNKTMDKSNTPKTETESNPKACEQKQLDSTNPDNRNIPQNDKDMDSANDKPAIHENSVMYNLADTPNKDDIDNETVEQLEQNPNINILGVATIDEQKPQQSSQLSSTISSENILSEFDETVEYPSKNSSESSSSGSSPPHSDDNDEKQGELS